MDVLFYALGSVLILSCLLDLRIADPEKWVAFGLVRLLFLLPVLAGAYLYFSPHRARWSA